MKISKIERIQQKYKEYDISTDNANFFVASGDTAILVHNSPNIQFGKDPKSKQFFVGTKSVFNKENPKVNYSFKDIEKNHFDKPGLVTKLKFAFKYLKDLNPKYVYSADMLFTKNDVKKQKIDDVEYLIFKPNAITYAVPVTSEDAKAIHKAQVGIVVHTRYTGSTLKDLTPDYDNIQQLKGNSNVYLIYNNLKDVSDKIIVSEEDENYIEQALKKIKELGKKLLPFLNELNIKTDIQDYILQYENSLVKVGDKKAEYKTLIDFINNKINIKFDTLKTERGKENRSAKSNEVLRYLEKNKNNITAVFGLQHLIVEIKNKLIYYLEQISIFNNYIEDNGKFNLTKPEGFVVSTKDGTIVKLIDRHNFSYYNFNLKKDWK